MYIVPCRKACSGKKLHKNPYRDPMGPVWVRLHGGSGTEQRLDVNAKQINKELPCVSGRVGEPGDYRKHRMAFARLGGGDYEWIGRTVSFPFLSERKKREKKKIPRNDGGEHGALIET